MSKKAQGMKYADNFVKEAISERRRKGYRENLGYDRDNDLADICEGLGLSYVEKAEVMQYFYRKCVTI